MLDARIISTGRIERAWPRAFTLNKSLSTYLKSVVNPDTFILEPIDKACLSFSLIDIIIVLQDVEIIPHDSNFGLDGIDCLLPMKPFNLCVYNFVFCHMVCIPLLESAGTSML